MTIPTGRKIPYGTVRLEYLSEFRSGRTTFGYLGLGIGTSFETEIRTEYFRGDKTVGTIDFAYNYISPIPGITPGISVGVQDLSESTVDGRRVYAALTFREPFETVNGSVMADTTLGLYLHGPSIGFVGVSVPFSKEFRILVEHNGLRFTSGVEIRPVPSVGVRLLYRESDTLVGVSWTGKL
jgi:hypothetical protein